ncbi:MAG: glyoxalase-like protein [Ramlibacter sp.]|nr:glyoxalase-like protein [Ramlibacter sp.]
MSAASTVDHLVVAADSLEQGVQWCEATLGVTPGPGGKHPLMGTHNRLLRISTASYPRAYLEIIAIDPAAPDPNRSRWFDLDDVLLKQQIRQQPRLVHFVARTTDARSALQALQQIGIDRGELIAAQRPTADGLLEWRISIRSDGQRLFYGGLPTLIEWDSAHPTDAMPDCGVALQSLDMRFPRDADLNVAYTAVGLNGVAVEQGTPNLTATLATPKGVVTLESAGF